MSFLLKSSRIKVLETKAASWDSLVQAISEANPEITAEQVTAEMIIDQLSEDNTSQIQDLEASVSTAQTRIQELEAENETLRGLPAAPSAEVTSDSEPSGLASDFASFLEKNKGDHTAIISEMQKQGLI